MSKKVSELSGDELDYWVAKAEVEAGHFTFNADEHDKPLITINGNGACSTVFGIAKPHHYGPRRGSGCGDFTPSMNWLWCGPIIERERIHLSDDYTGEWEATWFDDHPYTRACACFGSTPLIAAMRAYVASVYGEELGE